MDRAAPRWPSADSLFKHGRASSARLRDNAARCAGLGSRCSTLAAVAAGREGRSVLRAVGLLVNVVLVLLGVATVNPASAQCTGEPEIAFIEFHLGGYTIDDTHEIDEELFRASYSESGRDVPGLTDDDTPNFFWFETEQIWTPGNDWPTLKIYVTELVHYILEVVIEGTCFRRVIHVGGPDLYMGTTGPCHRTCTYLQQHRYEAFAPYHVWGGLSEYDILDLNGEVMVRFAIDIEILDARIRVQYGPALDEDGWRPNTLPTSAMWNWNDWSIPDGAVPEDELDPFRTKDAISEPIVSRCIAGPWTYEDLHTHHPEDLRRGVPELPPREERWPYVCMSFAKCVPPESNMSVFGDIPPSLPLTVEDNRGPNYLAGTFRILEFAPTPDEIGVWEMEIVCADNEGNVHRRPWTVIVEPDPNEASGLRSLCGCNHGAGQVAQSIYLALILPLLLYRRRPSCPCP